jgi:hypothetical protein
LVYPKFVFSVRLIVIKALCPGKDVLNKKKYFAKDHTVTKATAQSFTDHNRLIQIICRTEKRFNGVSEVRGTQINLK